LVQVLVVVAATATAGLAAAAVAAVSAAVALRTKACLSTSSDFQKLMDLFSQEPHQ
jgi:hypothetical protein